MPPTAEGSRMGLNPGIWVKCLNHHLLPPRIHISRKQKQNLQPGSLMWDTGGPSGAVTSAPNASLSVTFLKHFLGSRIYISLVYSVSEVVTAFTNVIPTILYFVISLNRIHTFVNNPFNYKFFHPLVHFPDRGWATPKLGAKSFFQVSHMDGRGQKTWATLHRLL